MTLGKYRFRDLDAVIDRVHGLFECWEAEAAAQADLDLQALYRMKLAVHEWLANLVQHACFGGRQPDILVELCFRDRHFECVIEDNSSGFDLEAQLVTRQEVLEAYPERGMGLLMLQACTKELSYRRVAGGRNRLIFTVSTNQDPWLPLPF